MKQLIIVLLCSTFNLIAQAQVLNTGLFNGNAFTDLTDIGTVAWSNVNNIKTANDTSATAYVLLAALGSANTHYITASSFGYSLPLNAQVQGIQVSVRRKAAGLGVGSTIRDYRTNIIKNGTVLNTNLGYTSTNWGTSYTTVTYGSDTSKWGTTWTADDINNASFGVAFASRLYAGVAGLGLTVHIDQIQTIVYYTIPSSPLPVKMVSFTGSLIRENEVQLNWATALEINNSHFEIERSTDTKTWVTLGEVTGNGTSTTMLNYPYIDNNATEGIAYYRLKQVDYDGAWEYSPVISVLVKDDLTNIMEVHYSTNGVVSITNASNYAPTSISLYNLNGATIRNNLNMENNQLDLGSLHIPQGLYVLTVTNAQQTISCRVYKPM
ncbi:MAG: T9SS type A sorting domain-containing protein [Bacteroidetes bacterium]|nr:T9SS type A sorting domain-containing protein [Bacteroidota bacterium]